MSKRNKKSCDKCNKDISFSNFSRHYNSCNGVRVSIYDQWKIGDNLYRYDDGYIGNLSQIKLHKVNVERKNINGTGNLAEHCRKLKSGEIKPWNYGKTKENNPEISDKLSAGGKALAKKIELNEVPCNLVIWAKSDIGRKTKSEWRKQLHKDNPETHPNRRVAANGKNKTYPEKITEELLNELNINFLYNDKKLNYYPDFILLDFNVIIEIDGEQWHQDKQYDDQRDLELASLGYMIWHYKVGKKKDLIKRIRHDLEKIFQIM